MTYVPIVTPPPTGSSPSPRVRDLVKLLSKVLDEYTKAHPKTTPLEIRQALRLAAASQRQGRPGAGLVLALSMGVFLVAGLTLGFFFAGPSGGGTFREASPVIIMAVIIFLALALIVIRRRGG